MSIELILGKTLTEAEHPDHETIVFRTTEGEVYHMYHEQDCCEHVTVEEIIGDLNDLVGHPILVAEEVSSSDPQPGQENAENHWGSFTWTFYKISTILGSVTIRWYGESNGYYSEAVTVAKVQ